MYKLLLRVLLCGIKNHMQDAGFIVPSNKLDGISLMFVTIVLCCALDKIIKNEVRVP